MPIHSVANSDDCYLLLCLKIPSLMRCFSKDTRLPGLRVVRHFLLECVATKSGVQCKKKKGKVTFCRSQILVKKITSDCSCCFAPCTISKTKRFTKRTLNCSWNLADLVQKQLLLPNSCILERERECVFHLPDHHEGGGLALSVSPSLPPYPE